MTHHDPRLHAFRPDLADRRLEGAVSAERFVEGVEARIGVSVADLKRAPHADAGLDTQLLCGAALRVFDRSNGWAWVQAEEDSYVGYLDVSALAPVAPAPTHRVHAPRTFLYPAPDMKSPRTGEHSLGAALTIGEWTETPGLRYGRVVCGGWIVANHLHPIDEVVPDFVSIAEALSRTPYLWGGVSGFGIDCSGLVQLSLRMAGKHVPRDTDLQATLIGAVIDPDQTPLRRGDLVFWRGHVGIMVDEATLIHANGHTMDVSLEPLADAVSRIGYLYGEPTAYRRP